MVIFFVFESKTLQNKLQTTIKRNELYDRNDHLFYHPYRSRQTQSFFTQKQETEFTVERIAGPAYIAGLHWHINSNFCA